MSPVVVVTRDSNGFTHLRCALDLAAAEAEDWVAEVSYARGPSGGLRVDLHDVDDESLDLACAVARDELRMDPHADLSYLATHAYVDGVLQPLARRVA